MSCNPMCRFTETPYKQETELKGAPHASLRRCRYDLTYLLPHHPYP